MPREDGAAGCPQQPVAWRSLGKTSLFWVWFGVAALWSAWIVIRAFGDLGETMQGVAASIAYQSQIDELTRRYSHALAINAGLLLLPWVATAAGVGVVRAYRRR